jgi:chaperonin GroES
MSIGTPRSGVLKSLYINKMNFKPLSNHLFLEPLEEEKITKGGIVLPDTAEKEKPIKGKVLAVGPGKRNDKGEVQPMGVSVGDVVLFKKYGPDEVEFEGKKYLVGDEDDILAILG